MVRPFDNLLIDMSTLTKNQKKKVSDALVRGVKDLVIAEVLKVSVDLVRDYRVSLGYTRTDITNTRYAYWKRMLNEGKSLEEIAELYGVKPNSVKLMLWHTERFSLVEAKKKRAREKAALVEKSRKTAQFSW